MKTKAKCQEVAMPANEKEDDTDEESIFVKVRMTINKKVRTTNKIQMITIFDSLKHMCTTLHFYYTYQYIFEQLACNSRGKHIDAHRSGHCELCISLEETTNQFIKCINYQRFLARLDIFVTIIEYMHNLGAPDDLTTCFWFSIQSWLKNTEPPSILEIVSNAGDILKQA